MTIHRSSKKITSAPPPLEKITRTHELTVLGVSFNSRPTLSFSLHTQNLTAKAATSLYAHKECFFVKEYFPVPSSGGNQCKNRHAPIWHFG